MPLFRVVRGNNDQANRFAVGVTWNAETAEEAVKKDCEATRKLFSDPFSEMVFGKLKANPIINVYEMVPVPQENWKPHASI